MSQLLKGVEIVTGDGQKVTADKHLEGKIVALYFSAGWCPPCRAFTPKLKVCTLNSPLHRLAIANLGVL